MQHQYCTQQQAKSIKKTFHHLKHHNVTNLSTIYLMLIELFALIKCLVVNKSHCIKAVLWL